MKMWWHGLEAQLVERLTTTAAEFFRLAWLKSLGDEPRAVEDVVHSMCTPRTGDAAAVLGRARVRCIYQILEHTPGLLDPGTPVWAPSVNEWLAAAGDIADTLRAPAIRSAVLLLAAHEAPELFSRGSVDALRRLDAAALRDRLTTHGLESDEKLTTFRIPAPATPVASASIPITPERHAYFRLEVSGAHTGSAHRWHSFLAATRDGAAAAIVEELSHRSGLAFACEEFCEFVLEGYAAGRRVFRENVLPHVSVRFGTQTLILPIPFDELDRLFESEHSPVVSVDLSAMPTVVGAPIPDDALVPFELDGVLRAHPPGWIGDWDFNPSQALGPWPPQN